MGSLCCLRLFTHSRSSRRYAYSTVCFSIFSLYRNTSLWAFHAGTLAFAFSYYKTSTTAVATGDALAAKVRVLVDRGILCGGTGGRAAVSGGPTISAVLLFCQRQLSLAYA